MLYGSVDGSSSRPTVADTEGEDVRGEALGSVDLPGALAADLLKGVGALREADRAETTCKRKWTALLAELRAQQQNIKVTTF